MGTALSVPPPADEPCDAAAVAERQRAFELFDSLDPGRAFRWVEHAWFMYLRGGGADRARPVFRTALARVADYGCVYGAWTHMEAAQPGGAAAARELFGEWRARCAADGGGEGAGRERAEFWDRYLAFELAHGGAERARAAAEAAVAACPRDAAVRARCVMAEAQLGDDERARAAFDRARADLAADADAEGRLTEAVRWEGGYLSEQWYGGCLGFCRGRWFRPLHWWEQL
ncbi:hypothetical protein ACP70R_003864 [Stipagrostis hirtigluma subsp. patula]